MNYHVIGVTLGITAFVISVGASVAVMIYTTWKSRRH